MQTLHQSTLRRFILRVSYLGQGSVCAQLGSYACLNKAKRCGGQPCNRRQHRCSCSLCRAPTCHKLCHGPASYGQHCTACRCLAEKACTEVWLSAPCSSPGSRDSKSRCRSALAPTLSPIRSNAYIITISQQSRHTLHQSPVHPTWPKPQRNEQQEAALAPRCAHIDIIRTLNPQQNILSLRRRSRLTGTWRRRAPRRRRRARAGTPPCASRGSPPPHPPGAGRPRCARPHPRPPPAAAPPPPCAHTLRTRTLRFFKP